METDDEFIERLNKLEFGSQQQAIDDLNRFDVLNSAADAFDEDRAAEVFEVFKYFYRGFPINFSNFKMFRSRNVGYLGLVENERQLNYPGPNMVPDFERCNFPGQPIFYGSSNTPTTFLELDLQNKRDCVITGEYDLLEGEPLNLIVVGEIDHFRRHGRTMVNTAGLGERINDICRQLSGHALIGGSYCDAFPLELLIFY